MRLVGASCLVVLVVVLCSIVVLSFRSIENELKYREDWWKEIETQYRTYNNELQEYIQNVGDVERPQNRTTIFSESDIIQLPYEASDKHAIVTMIGSPSITYSYWMGALAIIQGLREVKTRVPNIVIMVREDNIIPQFAFEAFTRLGARIIEIPPIPVEDFYLDFPWMMVQAFDKLNVFRLTEFEKVLFLDADTLVVQNIDHLLNEEGFTAAESPKYSNNCEEAFTTRAEFYSLSAGFFVCRPSLKTYEEIADLLSHPSKDPEDIEFFGGSWHGGMKKVFDVQFNQNLNVWNRLSRQYDMPVILCSCPNINPLDVYSYHFTGSREVPKPWQGYLNLIYSEEKEDCVRVIHQLWFKLLSKALNAHHIKEEYPEYVPFEPTGEPFFIGRVIWE